MEELICLLSPDLSVLIMFSVLRWYWGRGWWPWGLLSPLDDVMPFCLSLSARASFVCWHRGVFRVYFHACLLYTQTLRLHECNEPVGSAGANEMYRWPHNPAALNTLRCVHMATEVKHPLRQTDTLLSQPSIQQPCSVWHHQGLNPQAHFFCLT